MTSNQAQSEVDVLRKRITEYEQALAAVAPRLAAFKQLEELAKARATTPEAVAASAALRTLKREAENAATLAAEMQHEREDIQAEMSLVLIQKKAHEDRCNALRADSEVLSKERDLLRTQKDELREEREHLGEDVSSLRTELSELMEKRDAISAGNAQLLDSQPPAVQANDFQAGDQGFADGTDARSGFDRRKSGIMGDDAGEGDEAFDRFFDADIEHDKSRDWILK